MARICSFQIQYKNKSYPTLVSIANNESDVVFTVHFVERELRYLEPGDKLVYCRKAGLKQPQGIPQELFYELNRCFNEWMITLPTDTAQKMKVMP